MHCAGLFAGAARCHILWSDGAPKRMSSGLAARVKAAPLQALGIRAFVLHSQIFESEDDDEYDYDFDLRNLDFPPLFYRIRHGLNDLHVLQTFVEAGLR
jgi:hypothetical protein